MYTGMDKTIIVIAYVALYARILGGPAAEHHQVGILVLCHTDPEITNSVEFPLILMYMASEGMTRFIAIRSS